MDAGYPLVEVTKVFRQALVAAGALALAAIVASIALGHPLVGPGAVIGLALGAVNNLVFQGSAARFAAMEGPFQRKPFAKNVLGRLLVVGAVAIALVAVLPPLGWGAIGGLVGFQIELNLLSLRSLFGQWRKARRVA